MRLFLSAFAACLIVLLTSAPKLHAVGGVAECTTALSNIRFLQDGASEPKDGEIYQVYFDLFAQIDLLQLKELQTRLKSEGVFKPRIVGNIMALEASQTLTHVYAKISKRLRDEKHHKILNKALNDHLVLKSGTQEKRKSVRGKRKDVWLPTLRIEPIRGEGELGEIQTEGLTLGFNKNQLIGTMINLYTQRAYIVIWNLKTERIVRKLELDSFPEGKIVFNRKLGLLAISGYKTIEVWDLKSGKRKKRKSWVRYPTFNLLDFYFTPSGKLRVISKYRNRKVKVTKLIIWDFDRQKVLREISLKPHQQKSDTIIFYLGGRSFAAFANVNHREIFFYGPKGFLDLSDLQKQERVMSMTLSPDKQLLTIGTSEGFVRIYDYAEKKLIKTIELKSKTTIVHGKTIKVNAGIHKLHFFSANKFLLAIGFDKAVLVNLKTGRSLKLNSPGTMWNRFHIIREKDYLIVEAGDAAELVLRDLNNTLKWLDENEGKENAGL